MNTINNSYITNSSSVSFDVIFERDKLLNMLDEIKTDVDIITQTIRDIESKTNSYDYEINIESVIYDMYKIFNEIESEVKYPYTVFVNESSTSRKNYKTFLILNTICKLYGDKYNYPVKIEEYGQYTYVNHVLIDLESIITHKSKEKHEASLDYSTFNLRIEPFGMFMEKFTTKEITNEVRNLILKSKTDINSEYFYTTSNYELQITSGDMVLFEIKKILTLEQIRNYIDELIKISNKIFENNTDVLLSICLTSPKISFIRKYKDKHLTLFVEHYCVNQTQTDDLSENNIKIYVVESNKFEFTD